MKPRLQFRRPLAWLACVLLAGVAGPGLAGTPKHEILIEALCRDPGRGAGLHSYLIRPAGPVVDKSGPCQQATIGHLRTALSGLGLFEATGRVRPDLIIEYDCGLGAPRTVYVERTAPVYEVQDDASGRTGLTTRIPRDARRALLVGYATVRRPVQVCDKYLSVTARAFPATDGEAGPRTELWRVCARITDDGTELTSYLPVLAAAVLDRAGFTTDGNVAMTLADNSASVAFIQRGF